MAVVAFLILARIMVGIDFQQIKNVFGFVKNTENSQTAIASAQISNFIVEFLFKRLFAFDQTDGNVFGFVAFFG